jgi:hypothetical protein
MERDSVKIEMHSAYKHLHKYWGEGGIPFYNDKYVMGETKSGAMALLIEPRSLLPEVYDYIGSHYGKFKYVFTHDSILLNTLPNAKLIIWGGVWSWGDEKKDFSHPISMVASEKGISPIRIARRNLAFELKDNSYVDTYGTFDGGERADTDTIYGKYPFSIVIENHIDEFWITEKICNCFSHKTVPIYYGAEGIDYFFNKRGILIARSIDDVKSYVNILSDYGWSKKMYEMRRAAIEENYWLVKEFENFDVWFMNHYYDLLREQS